MIKEEKVEAPALAPQLALVLSPEASEPQKKSRRKKLGRKKIRKAVLGIVFFVVVLAAATLHAQTPSVPPMIHFQSVLADGGGTPLADGLHSINFRLLNAGGSTLYEETQSLESHKGVVSAMVGAKGGLPLSALTPNEPKLLGVKIAGTGPETLLEIVSVPYALHAQQALSVAAGSVTTAGIQPKAITLELLADNLLNELVTQSQFSTQFAAMRQEVNAVNAKVDQTQTNVVTLQGQVTQLSETVRALSPVPNANPDPAPKLAAAGHIWYPSELDADLSSGYNVSQVLSQVEAQGTARSFDGTSWSAGVFFQNSIAPPYYVQLTPLNQAVKIFVRSFDANRIVVDAEVGQHVPQFHFVVYK